VVYSSVIKLRQAGTDMISDSIV